MTLVENLKHLSIGQSIGDGMGKRYQIENATNLNENLSNNDTTSLQKGNWGGMGEYSNDVAYEGKKKKCEIL
ncbi:hypothetical protein CYY_001975 [Polysphondylium violaceum]|uniref:Uncharacterized protein n=1 Tax=Polysphondylium violaceum TaxID=133409 RepID=A0A8J4PYV3_9MYCE|nr:hypothetical protein CYY_001975 [Polysphondylium violaceum]